MSAMEMINVNPAERRTVIDIARELGAIFGERANAAKDEDKFVADNFSLLNGSASSSRPTRRGSSVALANAARSWWRC